MNTYRYTPEKIVEEKLYFSIPLYQRLFSWGEEQIKGLLYDLKNHFETTRDDTPYYLGMLSCIKSGNQYDLIDGQQRFTVMTLFAIVLRNYYKEWNGFLDDGKRLKFVSRTKDNEYLAAVINRQPDVLDPNRKMDEAVKFISDFMISQFPSNDLREKYAQNIYHRMSFFFSELPDSYANNPASLNKYFEAMNAGGKGLEQHEVLKVMLMRGEDNKEHLTRIWNAVCDLDRPVIKRDEKDLEEDYRSKYEQAISLCRENNFDEAFILCESSYDSEDNNEIGNIEAEQHNFNQSFIETGERSLISFPEFLMMVIDVCLNLSGSYSFYRKELLNVYGDHLIANKQDFYNQLLFYRLLLDYYIVHKEGYETANKYDIVFKQGSSVEALRQYQSMLYVSQIPFYNWIKPVLTRLHSEPVRDTNQLLAWIKEIDDSIHELPASVEEMAYDKGIDKYWFWRLDYYLWERKDKYFATDKAKQIVDEYVFRTNRSIEHVAPQHPQQNSTLQWDENNPDDGKKRDCLGNLCMISNTLNSTLRNSSYEMKKAYVDSFIKDGKFGTIESLKLLKIFEKYDVWNKDNITEHGKEMFEILKDSFSTAE